jgi:hypothetical protein
MGEYEVRGRDSTVTLWTVNGSSGGDGAPR